MEELSSIKFELCNSEFFNLNDTWYTDQPRFSACFRNTFLVWLPACLFVLATASECSAIRQAKIDGKKPIPRNRFNTLRRCLVLCLFLVKLGEFSSYVYTLVIDDIDNKSIVENASSSSLGLIETFVNSQQRHLVISTLLAPIVPAICYLILVIIYHNQRKAGLHTSGPIWLYLFVLLISNAIDIYAVIFPAFSGSVVFNNLFEQILKFGHMGLLLLLFIFECYGDKAIKERDLLDVRPDSPELRSSFCSSITFWWFNKFLIASYKSRIDLTNLWKTLPRDRAANLVPKFMDIWIRGVRGGGHSARKRGETYQMANGEVQPMNNLNYVIFKLFWRGLLLSVFLKLGQDLLQFTTPMILKQLLAYMRDENAPIWHGILYTVLLLVVPTFQSILLGNYFFTVQLVGLQFRSTAIGAIYRKSLLLSGSSRLKSTTGEIVNLMAVDSQRFQDLAQNVNLFWSAPFQIILSIFLLYRELGWSIFAGVICMALVLPANAYLANRIKFSQIKVMKTKDQRVKHMNEVLSGIRVIKLYAWENSFIANLLAFRGKELSYLRRIQIIDAIQTFLWQCSPFAVACVTFAVYASTDSANVLNAEKAFVSISLFNLLRFPLTMLPGLITSLILTLVSSRRLTKFLNSNELIQYVTRNEELEAISIEGGTLSWSREASDHHHAHNYQEQQQLSVESETRLPAPPLPASLHDKAILRDIDLHVKAKSFVAIVGHVASGKSSLVSAILGEMNRLTGRFNVCKSMSMALVPQQAWIQNMTVRENILFGARYDEAAYQRVLAACSLAQDLETLPGGDQAEIGEKGINLSGGQKQRVSLARACYSNSDIYLLDDPLSALDSHVAKHVFDKVLSSTSGLLRHKTRVLATNSLFLLPHVDYVIVLERGRIVESGTYKDLMANTSGQLADFMRQYSATQEKEKDQQQQPTNDQPATGVSAPEVTSDSQATPPISAAAHIDVPPVSSGRQSVDRTASLESSASQQLQKIIGQKSATDQLASSGKLTDIERVEMGSVNFSVYLAYFYAVTKLCLVGVMVPMFASSAFNVGTNLWLSEWASDADEPSRAMDTGLRTMRLIVYAILGTLQCFTSLLAGLALSIGAIKSARYFHSELLERIMHSPMNFFDTTPIGRVVNRFAKDIDVVDSNLPGTFRSWFQCFLHVLSTLFVICYSFPTFFSFAIPLAIVYYLIQRIFIVTTRQLKRLESTTRSPIYSNFNETLSGVSTIRAYNCVDRFVGYSDNLVDRNQTCSYPNLVATRWLSIRLEFLGNLITCAAALFSIYYKGTISAGTTGLTISYSLSITQTLSWLVRMTSDLETNIVSVERILEYMRNKQEDAWIKDTCRPPPNWPHSGTIAMENYSTRYRSDTELVLRNISLDVRASEKIGIVGRTGSGKSSLSLALFRILEPSAGCIRIDGLNLTDFGLHDIRSKLTIIPQDPVLFSGTLRFNLDPLKLYTDLDIWRSLELAHLADYIRSLKLGLDYLVSEYGENFSVGQRQLICLARAILRKSKILILDEATASIDLETDSIVQRTIRDIFSECTIITIAHRLHTILDSDRILVLEAGAVRELDSPARLVADPKSALASLVRDAGIEASNFFKN